MQNFSSYMGTLETYIMFQIKAKMVAMSEELTKKGRKPIALSMGAPVDMVPDYVIERTKEHLKDPKITPIQYQRVKFLSLKQWQKE